MKRQTSPGAGSDASNKLAVVLTVGLLVVVALAIFLFAYISKRSGYEEQYALRASEQRVIAQQLVENSIAAASGDQPAFDRLQASRDKFDTLMDELRAGVPSIGLPPSPKEAAPELQALEAEWLELRQNADNILTNRESINSVRQMVDRE